MEALLAELEDLAERLGIATRIDRFSNDLKSAPGGLCWVSGRPILVLREGQGIAERVAVFSAALRTFDLERTSLSSEVRALLTRRGAGRLG